eukprot:12173359-Alexandrium_andersonii.AAC.1
MLGLVAMVFGRDSGLAWRASVPSGLDQAAGHASRRASGVARRARAPSRSRSVGWACLPSFCAELQPSVGGPDLSK